MSKRNSFNTHAYQKAVYDLFTAPGYNFRARETFLWTFLVILENSLSLSKTVKYSRENNNRKSLGYARYFVLFDEIALSEISQEFHVL